MSSNSNHIDDDSDVRNVRDNKSGGECSSSLSVEQLALAARKKVLPRKSEDRYKCTWKNFLNWHAQQNCSNFHENVLLAYFQDIV